MGYYPTLYNKKRFKKFLIKNNVNDGILKKFAELPITVTVDNIVYDLYIYSVWYSFGNTYYTFELNYYSDANIEFLFHSKQYNDVESSINNLLCELATIKKL